MISDKLVQELATRRKDVGHTGKVASEGTSDDHIRLPVVVHVTSPGHCPTEAFMGKPAEKGVQCRSIRPRVHIGQAAVRQQDGPAAAPVR